MNIRWAKVGTGKHVRNWMMPAIVKANGAKLSAICGRDISRAQELSKRFGCVKVHETYEALLQDKTVDVVYIATPNSLHAEMIIKAAQAGKHVLVEKPMALTCVEAEAMINACEIHKVKLGVGFHLRHHPAHKEARERILLGQLGRVFLFDARWVSKSVMGEGWWLDQAVADDYRMMTRGKHLVDLIWFLSNKRPKSVMMFSDGINPSGTSVGFIKLKDNSLATIVVTYSAVASPNSFTVLGTKGFLQGVHTIGPNSYGILTSLSEAESQNIFFQPMTLTLQR